jgi:hypothetical protein
MSELTPCPECQRHVRKSEARCPFCAAALSLAHLPSPVLPRKRLGRAATFAFGASVVGATALVACGDTESDDARAIYGAPPSTAGTGGSSAGTSGTFGGTGVGGGLVYGSPPSGGTSNDFAGAGNSVYGAPASGGSGDEEVGGAGGVASTVGGAADSSEGGAGAGTTIYGGPPSGAGGV